MIALRPFACALPLLLAALPVHAQGAQPTVESVSTPFLTIDGRRFRDLDRNGTLERYEDWRLPSATRAADLVSRMTLAEKAGAAVHGTAPSGGGPMGGGRTYDTTAAAAQILTRHVNSVITRLSIPPADFAAQNNALQAIAERSRLGIPLTISTDPRNHFQVLAGASVATSGFSQWPETLGLGALDDPALVKRFATIIRNEYRAVGIQMALSPQADLATEPRWSRITGTFGESPSKVGTLVNAYVQGMQGSDTGLTRDGVATVVKHWVGYGASVDGFDGHNYYGRYARFPGNRFQDHVTPFLGAIASGVVGVMPTYDILDGLKIDGTPVEAVGAGFNRQLLAEQLRGKHRFRGMVLSDWAITQDCSDACMTGQPRQSPQQIAMPWGVESLSKTQRFAKGMNAGIDQFGGVDDGKPFVDAVGDGSLKLARLDEAVARMMVVKFDLGLFENPFVDAAKAGTIVGNAEYQREATAAQSKALVVLENSRGARMLPAAGARLFVRGVDTNVVKAQGYRVAATAADADVALIRLNAPYQTLHPTFFFGSFQHEGDLDFKDTDSTFTLVKETAAKVPTIVVVYLDRPAILTSLVPLAKTLIGEFGVSDVALFDALTGKVRPVGRLPFELPRSMAAVQAQTPDVPHDSPSPLYPIGFRRSR
ncbi:MAG TPA: glycoside hydrolase family 3 N-terminal domain-containing protein [Gemmatimonadaceae bacterium]|nr:glycoside hydrolase family 3 N-terminal domain-containing protein [Gemmatimonadaceae bacterium]